MAPRKKCKGRKRKTPARRRPVRPQRVPASSSSDSEETQSSANDQAQNAPTSPAMPIPPGITLTTTSISYAFSKTTIIARPEYGLTISSSREQGLSPRIGNGNRNPQQLSITVIPSSTATSGPSGSARIGGSGTPARPPPTTTQPSPSSASNEDIDWTRRFAIQTDEDIEITYDSLVEENLRKTEIVYESTPPPSSASASASASASYSAPQASLASLASTASSRASSSTSSRVIPPPAVAAAASSTVTSRPAYSAAPSRVVPPAPVACFRLPISSPQFQAGGSASTSSNTRPPAPTHHQQPQRKQPKPHKCFNLIKEVSVLRPGPGPASRTRRRSQNENNENIPPAEVPAENRSQRLRRRDPTSYPVVDEQNEQAQEEEEDNNDNGTLDDTLRTDLSG